MDIGAGVLLLWGMGRLEDEDGLGGEEDASGVKDLTELLAEHFGQDCNPKGQGGVRGEQRRGSPGG